MITELKLKILQYYEKDNEVVNEYHNLDFFKKDRFKKTSNVISKFLDKRKPIDQLKKLGIYQEQPFNFEKIKKILNLNISNLKIYGTSNKYKENNFFCKNVSGKIFSMGKKVDYILKKKVMLSKLDAELVNLKLKNEPNDRPKISLQGISKKKKAKN